MRSKFIVLVAAASLAACAKKDAPAGDSVTQQAATPNVVTVHATDFAFDGPAEIPAGMTTFKLANDGMAFHHLSIARIDSGKTIADVNAALAKPGAPPPAWLVFVGGPNGPDPKTESNATLDLPAGEYAMICFIDAPGGVPHFAKGMIKAFSVKPATTASAPAPTADVDITLSDYKFALSKDVAAGTHTFAVHVDAAGQAHELELIKLAPGKTADDFMKWMGGKMDTPPPGSGLGGISPAIPGKTVYFSADLAAGDYLLVCFVPDAKDGKPHFLHGMMQALKVT